MIVYKRHEIGGLSIEYQVEPKLEKEQWVFSVIPAADGVTGLTIEDLRQLRNLLMSQLGDVFDLYDVEP